MRNFKVRILVYEPGSDIYFESLTMERLSLDSFEPEVMAGVALMRRGLEKLGDEDVDPEIRESYTRGVQEGVRKAVRETRRMLRQKFGNIFSLGEDEHGEERVDSVAERKNDSAEGTPTDVSNQLSQDATGS